MEVVTSEENNIFNIVISGKIDSGSIADLKQTVFGFNEDGTMDIAIDLSKVDYLDSAFIGILIELIEFQKKNSRIVIVNGMNPMVKNVLEFSNIANLVEFNLSNDKK